MFKNSFNTILFFLFVAQVQATSFTWVGGAGGGITDWGTNVNWTPSSSFPELSTDTAVFGNSSSFPGVEIGETSPLSVSIASMTFNSSYSVGIDSGSSLTLSGAGIIGSTPPTFTSSGDLTFLNSATAGNSTLNNGSSGTLNFQNTSSAGIATIGNKGIVNFNNSSDSDEASITNRSTGTINFNGNSSADEASITNDGVLNFNDSSTAGNAVITGNFGDDIHFNDTATGNNAALILNGGTLDVSGMTTSLTVGSVSDLNLEPGDIILGNTGLSIGSNNTNMIFWGGISGGGSLTKVGTGALALPGNNSYTGTTSVQSGTLQVDGTIQSDTTVSSGAVLQGLGTINGNVINNGTVQPGDSAIGTLSISGNYVQELGATFAVDMTTTQNSLLTVTGTATLAGDVELLLPGVSGLVNGSVFTILETEGAINGLWTLETVGFGRFSPTLEYLTGVTNAVKVVIDAPSFESLALTPNQKAVAVVLDHLWNHSEDPNLIDALNSQTNASMPGFYDQLSPSNLTPMFKMGFSNSKMEAGLIGQRLSQFWVDDHFDSNATAWNDRGVRFAGNLPAQEEAQIAQSVQPDNWGAFAMGMGNFGTVLSDGNGAGYQFSSGGMLAGMDYRLAKDLVGGLLLGFDQSGSSQSTGKVSVTGGQVGLYAGWKQDQLHVTAMVDGGFDNYGTQRSTVGGTANGSTSGMEVTGQLSAGYDLKMDEVKITPYLSGQWTQVNVNGFTETGSLAPLTFAKKNESYLSTDLGAVFSRSWKVSGIQLSPNVSAAWEHVYEGNDDSLTANFGSGNNFTVQGAATGKDAVVLGVGLDAGFDKGLDVFASYQGKVGMTNYTEQSLSGGVNLGF